MTMTVEEIRIEIKSQVKDFAQQVGRLQAQVIAQSNDLISLQKDIQALEASIKLNSNRDSLESLESRLNININALRQELLYKLKENEEETTEWIEKTVKSNKVSFWDLFRKK